MLWIRSCSVFGICIDRMGWDGMEDADTAWWGGGFGIAGLVYGSLCYVVLLYDTIMGGGGMVFIFGILSTLFIIPLFLHFATWSVVILC